jgi:FdhD protein
LPDKLRQSQDLFESTGGLHAAALFDLDGNLLAVREDVGRHNALDKLIGWGVLNDQLPFHNKVLIVSGRASYELLQKSYSAGVPIFCAVSAPSSLAVDVAERFGITLVGFLRGNRFNIYTGVERIKAVEPEVVSS